MLGLSSINTEKVFGTKAQPVKPKETVNIDEKSSERTNNNKKRERDEEFEPRNIKKIKKMKLDQKRIEKKQYASERTLFLGNFPIAGKKIKKIQKQIKQLFEKYAKVEAIRIRNIATDEFKVHNKKLALVNNMINTKRKPFANAYVVFALHGSEKNDKTESDAQPEEKQMEAAEEAVSKIEMSKLREIMEKAIKELNASIFEGRHLVVDFVTNYDGTFTEYKQVTKKDHSRSVFLGNLPFDVDDEEIWELFEKKMNLKVSRVRVVRDPETQKGKGFGFVQLEDEADVVLATTKNNYFSIRDNLIRIYKSSAQAIKYSKEKAKREEVRKERAKQQSYRDKNLKKPEVANVLLQSLEDPSNPQSNPYSGIKADKKAFLERQQKQKVLKQKISKQNKNKHSKATKKQK